MSYTKCEPGRASGLGFRRVGVTSVHVVGSGGEANKVHKAYVAIPQLQWAKHPLSRPSVTKTGARVFYINNR